MKLNHLIIFYKINFSIQIGILFRKIIVPVVGNPVLGNLYHRMENILLDV